MGGESGAARTLTLAAAMVILAGCTGNAAPPTSGGETTTSVGVETTSATATKAPPTTATPPTSTTTTTLAPIPDALPIVDDGWDWVELLPVKYASQVRYDGTYLVYEDADDRAVVVMTDGRTIFEHTPLDDREWIVQDVELGDHWLGVVANTEQSVWTAQAVVYDLETGEVVFEETTGGDDQPFGLPSIAISGRNLAMSNGLPGSGCVDIYLLGTANAEGEPVRIGRICQDDPIWGVEIDGGDVAFGSSLDGCSTAWTADVYGGGPSHGLAPHSNRACWSNSPATSGPITVWFESNPAGSSGNDILLGENRAGGTVGLGRGLRGTAEACWAHAVWIGANRDIEFWDGGDTVTTVFSAGDAYGVGCVGPWVTVATADGIYASNMLTGSAVDACSTVEYADEGEAADLERTLLDWVHTNYTEVPSDVTTSVSAIGLDGWWIGGGSFSDYLEAAIFVWYPGGNIGVAWAGSADSVNDIRQYMFSVLPEAPTALLGCVNVSGFAEP